MTSNNVLPEATIGNRLRKLRKERNLTQQDVSDNMYKLSEKNYGKYERDDIIPPTERIIELANYFGVSTDYLLLGTNPNFDAQISECIEQCPLDKQEALLKIVEIFIGSVGSNSTRF